MAKTPVLGRVKRRLGREIGNVAALRFYRHCLNHTLLRLVQHKRWQTIIAVTPDRDRTARVWGRIGRLPQGEGDLGRRMQRLVTELLPGPTIIVGSDIPALSPSHVAQAFRLLRGADAVFGRAPDGGFWLVGLKRVPRVLKPFADVRWSSPHTLADTLANLEGKRVAFVATLADVDTKQEWRRERGAAERLIVVRQRAATAHV
jgi:rSAM/selenodomain-associated transferase 1